MVRGAGGVWFGGEGGEIAGVVEVFARVDGVGVS